MDDSATSYLGTDSKRGCLYMWPGKVLYARVCNTIQLACWENGGKDRPPPSGVKYPVWAWYKQGGKRAKPDLRRERWGYGPGDEEYCCIEIDLPNEQVLLSDFDAWSIILNNGLLSESEEEDSLLDSQYDSMPSAQQQLFKRENWNRVFDLTPVHCDWIIRGEWIQATFWVLKKEDVRSVVFFRTAKHRR